MTQWQWYLSKNRANTTAQKSLAAEIKGKYNNDNAKSTKTEDVVKVGLKTNDDIGQGLDGFDAQVEINRRIRPRTQYQWSSFITPMKKMIADATVSELKQKYNHEYLV